MVTITLSEHSAEDVKAIRVLRELGMDDEQIQKLVDRQAEIDRDCGADMRGKE